MSDGHANSEPVVEASGLTKNFGGFTAVDDVDITLEAGRITAMIGPNGAGKSTVINLISGVLLPTAGEIRLLGMRVDGRHPNEIANLGLARTFQTPRLFEDMTALETIMIARDRFGRGGELSAALHLPRWRNDERASRESALRWLEFVGLENYARTPATSLPVGNQRLVEVARALADEPTVLLLDEPAAGLDDTETHKLGELMRTIADHGIGVLLVEHDMRLVMSIADTVVVLDQGRQIAAGEPAEVGADPRVIEAYLGVATV